MSVVLADWSYVWYHALSLDVMPWFSLVFGWLIFPFLVLMISCHVLWCLMMWCLIMSCFMRFHDVMSHDVMFSPIFHILYMFHFVFFRAPIDVFLMVSQDIYVWQFPSKCDGLDSYFKLQIVHMTIMDVIWLMVWTEYFNWQYDK